MAAYVVWTKYELALGRGEFIKLQKCTGEQQFFHKRNKNKQKIKKKKKCKCILVTGREDP
jgi:hypothetical protein